MKLYFGAKDVEEDKVAYLKNFANSFLKPISSYSNVDSYDVYFQHHDFDTVKDSVTECSSFYGDWTDGYNNTYNENVDKLLDVLSAKQAIAFYVSEPDFDGVDAGEDYKYGAFESEVYYTNAILYEDGSFIKINTMEKRGDLFVVDFEFFDENGHNITSQIIQDEEFNDRDRCDMYNMVRSDNFDVYLNTLRSYMTGSLSISKEDFDVTSKFVDKRNLPRKKQQSTRENIVIDTNIASAQNNFDLSSVFE